MDDPFKMFESDFSDEMSQLNIDLGALFSEYTLGDFTSESFKAEMKPMLEEIVSTAENLDVLFDPMPPLSILSYPSCLDVNGDGDIDLLALSLKDEDCDLTFRYWEREGDGFIEQTEMDNPLDLCLVFDSNDLDLSPLTLFGHDFGDIDGDGNLNFYFSFKDTDANTNELICLDTGFDAEEPCIRIPTLSQWGIYILGLFVIIIGLVGIKSTSSLDIKQSVQD
jgi:hypothetical protein